jgi:hypothetical protein
MPVFNPGGKPNRTATTYDMQVGVSATTVPIHLWLVDNHPDAERWTYVQALRALLYLWVLDAGHPINVFQFLADTAELVTLSPVPNHADPFIARITAEIDDVSIQSMNVDEALTVLLDAAGLHWQIAIKTGIPSTRRGTPTATHYLRVWAARETPAELDVTRYMGVPELHDVPRESPFTVDPGGSVTPIEIARANAAHQAAITYDPRDTSVVRILGGYDEVEVSLMMRPGWPPHAQLDDVAEEDRITAREFWEDEFNPVMEFGGRIPRSVYHTSHPQHAANAKVFRFWMFPDDLTEVEAVALGRTTGAFTARRYRVRRAEDATLQYVDPVWGGDLTSVRTQDWIPRRRPFHETIARKNVATTDQSPIVRVHFGMSSVRKGTGLFVSVAEVSYTLGTTSYTLSAVDEFELPDDSTVRLYADGSATPQTSTTAWPANESPANHYRLALVTTSGGEVTLIVPWDRTTDVPNPDDPGWVEYGGQAVIDEDRAGVWLLDANMWNDPAFREITDDEWGRSDRGLAITDYINGHFWVQVTAVIRGDQRIWRESSTTASGYDGPPRATGTRETFRLDDLGFDKFQRRLTSGGNAGNSYLAGLSHAATDETEYRNRNDEDELSYLAAKRVKQGAGSVVAGDLEIFFITKRYRPGDSFTGCSGLGLIFQRLPMIERVTFTSVAQSGQRTKLLLTDTRDSPEAGAV